MSEFIINATNTSGDTGSIFGADFFYSDKLNELNKANIKIDSTDVKTRELIEVGTKIEIKRNGTREFFGLVDADDIVDGGGLNIEIDGFEIWLGKENGAYANSPYKATASATIFTQIIAESNEFTIGTVDTGLNIDFRIALTDSLWNAGSNLAKKVSQDIQIDYTNFQVDLLDNRGSLTSVAVLNDGVEIRNIRVSRSYPLGNRILVYGKGDGENQIISEYPAHGKDATSQVTFGIVTRPVIDRTIVSVAEANILADAEVLITKDPQKIYDFDVLDLTIPMATGDIITLNAKDKGLNNEIVRIVGIERGERAGIEFMKLQVTNAAYSFLIRKRNDILGQILKKQRDTDSYMQGAGNTLNWRSEGNADASTPHNNTFTITNRMIFDEANNRRVNNFTVDYDVHDKFEQYSGSDPTHFHSVAQHSTNDQDIIDFEATTSALNQEIGLSYTEEASIVLASGDYEIIWVKISFDQDEAEPHDMWYRIRVDGNIAIDQFISELDTGDNITTWHPILVAKTFASGFFVTIEFKSDASNVTVDLLEFTVYSQLQDHDHLVSEQNTSSANSGFNVDFDLFQEGSNVGEGDSTDADVRVQFWNGSTWVTKLTLSSQGLHEDDLDISDGNTLPDVAGRWRVQIDPDTNSGDFIQTNVVLKHHLDN